MKGKAVLPLLTTMVAPNWIARELKFMNPEFRPFYFGRYGKWMIVRDAPRLIGGMGDYDPISGKTFIVEMVIEDRHNRPLPLDRNALEAARECYYDRHSRPYSFYYHRMRQRQWKREERAQRERELAFKDGGREIHKAMTTETFV